MEAEGINNRFYDELHEQWIEGAEHPVALLRAENALRNPWVAQVLGERFDHPVRVLDVACGGGLLANFLAEKGHAVYGVDLSVPSLEVARKHDVTRTAQYEAADAYQLPYPDASFEAVCMMDFLEHVSEPGRAIREASRVLKKGGLLFFHTFNRNFWSWLLVIKGVEWCVRNTPPRMHVYELLIKPEELTLYCREAGLAVQSCRGVRPVCWSRGFWHMLFTRRVPPNFRFAFTNSLRLGYCGFAALNHEF